MLVFRRGVHERVNENQHGDEEEDGDGEVHLFDVVLLE